MSTTKLVLLKAPAPKTVFTHLAFTDAPAWYPASAVGSAIPPQPVTDETEKESADE
jgi:hypothetical protein